MIIFLIFIVIVGFFALLFSFLNGTVPEFLRTYHIYKYMDGYFVKVKCLGLITIKYVDKKRPLKYNWGLDNIDYCIVPSLEEARKLVTILKEVAKEVK